MHIGGEALPEKLLRTWSSAIQYFFNVYGPTEAAVDVTSCRCIPRVPFPVSIGYPLRNVHAVNAQKSAGNGVYLRPQELLFVGEQIARGYLSRPLLTGKAFRDKGGIRRYCTGDLSRYLPDGTIAFMGRIDCQVKLRGFRIELGEIENVLLSLTSSVVSAACTLVNNEYLAAYVVVIVGADDPKSAGSLMRHCSQHLPHYMVPSVFVFLDTMPLNRSGKVDRRALPAPPDLSRKSRGSAADVDAADVTPLSGTPAEIALLNLAQEALGFKLPQGLDANFMKAGGTSVDAVRFVNLVRTHLCPTVSLRTLFTAPTLRAFGDEFLAQNTPAALFEPAKAQKRLTSRLTARSSTGVTTWLDKPMKENAETDMYTV